MKLIGGLRTDSLPIDNAPNSWIDARNGILSKKYGGYSNEDGFNKIVGILTYNNRTDLTPVGVISVSNGYTVVFSLVYNGAILQGSEIGYIDNTDAQKYTMCVDPSKDVNNDLAFSWNHQITGETKLNNKGDIIVAFTDDNTKPKVANLSKLRDSATFNIEDILMFTEFTGTELATSIVDNGGSLSTAAYFITSRYEDNDGTQTNFNSFSNPVYIFRDSIANSYSSITGSAPNIATNKAIRCSFTNLDTNYTYLTVACIKVQDGIATAHIINKIPINSNSLDYVFTGSETLEDITLLEIQSKQDWVTKSKSITQIDRQLYLANLEYGVDIKYQKYANNIEIKWNSTLVDALTTSESAKHNDYNATNRTFMHDEVKNFYIVFELLNGSLSKAYKISGRTYGNIQKPVGLAGVTNGEISHISAFTGGLDTTYGLDYDDTLNPSFWRYYQTRCTAKTDGTMGFWRNEDEYYPVQSATNPELNEYDGSVDYDGNPIVGGRDLTNGGVGGVEVMHHRFPDITWLKENVYSAEDEYGRTKFDVLGIDVSNVVIPAYLEGIVKSWRIYYTTPTLENSLVATNDILHPLSYNTGDTYNSNLVKYNTAGNWRVEDNVTGNFLSPPHNISYNEKYKCHGFDLLNTPSLGSTYIKNHLLLYYGDSSLFPALSIISSDSSPVNEGVGYVDYTNQYAAIPTNLGYPYQVRKLTNDQYIPSNSVININGQDIINTKSESAYYFELVDTQHINAYIYGNLPAGSNDYKFNTTALQVTGTAMYSLMQYKTNLYVNFYTQTSFTSAGNKQLISGAGTYTGSFTCGDAVIADLCYTAYGMYDISTSLTANDARTGIKVMHRFIAPCRHNLSLRNLDGNVYSNYLPKIQSLDWLKNDIYTDINPTVAYNQDYSKVNTYDVIEPFNYAIVIETDKPYRIIRGEKPLSTEIFETWRVFQNNDFYELTPKNGEIWNIQGLSSGELLIQNNSLYKTRSIGRMESTATEVILGTGDLFQFPPQEIIPDNNGYIGTQHKIACKLTKYGYVSIDAELGRLFIVGDTVNELSSPKYGMRNFFRDFSKVDFGTLLEVDDNPITSAGINIEYDEKFNRLLVSKKQFELTDFAKIYYVDSSTQEGKDIIEGNPDTWPPYPSDSITHTAIFYKDYTSDGFKYHFTIFDVNAVSELDYVFSYGHEPLDIPFFFNSFWLNTGFTISYSFDFETWVAYHDYTPDYIFRTRNKLLSFNNYKLYSHNNPEVKAIYYNYDNETQGIPFSTYIIPIFNDNPLLAKEFYNLNWIDFLVDSNDFTVDDETFDRLLIWDNKQCSGTFNVDPFTQLADIYQTNCRKVKETWFLNSFRDLVVDHNSKFITGGNAVEYTEITTNIDTKLEYQLKNRFVDKWMAVKCIYDNTITDNEQLNWFLTQIDVLTQIVRR